MDFAPSKVQEMLRKDARRFLTDKCPKSYVRQMEEDERGLAAELWSDMARLGWMKLPFPRLYGGLGMSFMDLAVLLEEMGRACLPGPYFSTMLLGGLPIMEAGSEEQKREFLPKIGSGNLIMTMAITEPSASYEPAGIAVEAVAEGDHFTINGTKLFVSDAHVADYIICVARTAPKEANGISLFIVDTKSPGVGCSRLETIGSDRQCEVRFDNVAVPSRNLLGDLNQGWPIVERALMLAAAGKCAEMLGGAQQVLDMTVEYAKERVQFDKPIGSFQAVQHHCANMATDADSSSVLTYQAAWLLSQNLPCTKEVSMAKAWVSDAYRRVVATGHQLHGAIGFTKDHDLQLYYRRAKVAEVLFGDGDYHRERLAPPLALYTQSSPQR